MIDLTTVYMGLTLSNPIIAGASGLTGDLKSVKQLEEAGVGAIVLKSLFEEQIQLERFRFDEDQHRYDDIHAEMLTVFPELEYAGPAEHLSFARKVKETVSIPVIASLNAVTHDTWLEYAKLLEETGVDALELNLYASPRDFDSVAGEVESEQIRILREVKAAVKLPVSVKLSPFYTNVLNFIKMVDDENVDALVLFNRLFQPEIDVEEAVLTFPFNLSQKADHRLPLHYCGLLHGRVQADLCASTGILEGADIVRMILAGADCVQVVSAFYQQDPGIVRRMLADLEAWMMAKGYHTPTEFRGRLSKGHCADPWAYARAQYVKLLLKSDPIAHDSGVWKVDR